MDYAKERGNKKGSCFSCSKKNYYTTNLLHTRVGITGTCQVGRHADFWSKVCNAFDFDMIPNLISILLQRGQHKYKKII